MSSVLELAARAKRAKYALAEAPAALKNAALERIAQQLAARQEEILAANDLDLAAAKAAGMRPSLIDRLALSEKRILGMAEGVRQVAGLEDPVGRGDGEVLRPSGLRIGLRRVPLGVVAIIYEARPNVTVDAAALCLKAGNACVLRGGKEAIFSNIALAGIMRDALAACGLPADAVCLCEDTARQSALDLMGAVGLVDVLIPRGGAGLIRSVVDNARVPVIETGIGICHVYADAGCDREMARDIIVNAKCSRPSVCNAAEALLVHKDEAAAFLPMAYEALRAYKVELRCDEKALAVLGGREGIVAAADADFSTEFLDYILAVAVVEDADAAIAHINAHGSGHSEAIVTRDYARAQRFLDRVDAAAVYVNASTRFTDGFEFGFGGEIGISTQKLHARGPMGLEALTTTKYTVLGSGQIRV